VLKKEVTILKVVKFFAIITLNKFNGKKEVGGYISLDVNKNGVNVGFVT
jgi:hypothetical protein